MKPLKPIDPTWWARRGLNYQQQDGRARLVRLMERTKTTGWDLYIDDVPVGGSWPVRKFSDAKSRAARFDVEVYNARRTYA